MRSFFKIFFATFLALIVFSIVAFFVSIGMIGAALTKDRPTVAERSVLVIDLGRYYPEQAEKGLPAAVTGSEDLSLGLYDVVRSITNAAKDQQIKGIYLKANGNASGFAASEEIRTALQQFKNSGKFIVAYGETISQRAYYVANVSDKIYTHPEGGVDWKGYSINMYFFKGLLDKLEIDPQVFYAGQFKSATEPFRATEMTPANKLQMTEMINDLYSRLIISTSTTRNIDTATLWSIANNGSIQTAADAVKAKLLDGTRYDDEVKGEIRKWLKQSASSKINFIDVDKYHEAIDNTGAGADRIALIYAEGDIISGRSGDNGVIAGDDMRDLIRKARMDRNIKAIVLRVNSPGGSALASDVIWREVMLAKKAKPVVVSMGDYAASGGYYISCAADSIFADQQTLTGSIGVFSIIPNMKGFFNNKLGITFDGVKTGQFADMMTTSRPLTEGEKQIINKQTQKVYATFKQRVAEGRKKDTAFVETVAQGRVWTGVKAVELGLVDRIGSLNDAVASAARMAKLKDYRLREYPEERSWIETILGKNKKDEMKQQLIREEIGEEQFILFKQMKRIRSMIGNVQSRMPYELVIE